MSLSAPRLRQASHETVIGKAETQIFLQGHNILNKRFLALISNRLPLVHGKEEAPSGNSEADTVLIPAISVKSCTYPQLP